MKPPTGVVVVLVTTPTVELAAAIARTLVHERLIACANLVAGVRSLYEWEGALCDETETLLILKSRPEAFEQLRARIVELHPARVPEVVQLDVTAGHAPYLDWVRGQVPG